MINFRRLGPEIIANNLREFMKQKGIGVQTFAELMNTHENTIWNWLRGKCFPLSDKLYQASLVLEVRMEDFFKEETDGGKKTD
jgi:transcriptional regulator with XRE-family HTH domain